MVQDLSIPCNHHRATFGVDGERSIGQSGGGRRRRQRGGRRGGIERVGAGRLLGQIQLVLVAAIGGESRTAEVVGPFVRPAFLFPQGGQAR